jgi:peptide/nickel transport system ATP-binding protein
MRSIPDSGSGGGGAPNVLDVADLRVEFATRHGVLTVVDGVSFSLAPGEVLGVVGESGAGKSITGMAVVGLIDPPGRIAGGAVSLAGRRIDNLPDEELRRVRGRKIGVIFQDPLTSLDPLYTVGQQLTETIRVHLGLGASEARKRAIDLLARVGISAPDQRIDHYPHQFSGGMRQRVVIALALCADPMVVIADEPTTALDVSIQAQIIDLLKELSRERGMSVILVTHDMGVIAETADRVAVMYAGRIVEIGRTRDIIASPRHPYTRGLMSAIPRVGQAGGRLAQIEGAMPRLSEIPAGCAFAPRCPHAIDPCRSAKPALEPVERRRVACHLVQAGALP